jgi:hypothetical protein
MTNSKNFAKFIFCALNAFVAIDVNAAESVKTIEQKKQELLAIENRLDAKMQKIDEKLKLLEIKEANVSIVAPLPPEKITLSQTLKTDLPENLSEKKAADDKKYDKSASTVSYGSKGFEFKTDDKKFSMAIQNRLQFRYANPFDGDPRSLANLEQDQSSFMVRRARTKITGNAYWTWLKYNFQYDWSQPVLRDFNLDITKFSEASLRLGRGKVIYNDERVTSSGKQQFVNRSIVNDIFTVDRQQGAQLYGRLFPKDWYDFSYALGIFAGQGVGERNNDDDKMMYSARLQWNFLGNELEFSQSDTEFHEKPAASFAVAGMTNTSRCTAFETANDSCRALPDFKLGVAGQYEVNQAMEELRFKWRGFSFQHELHFKNVEDLFAAINTDNTTNLIGGYVQAGYFPHNLIPLVPKQLEFAMRYAAVDPNIDRDNDRQQEFTGAMNWFFSGHNNKLTFEVSHLTVEDPHKNIEKGEERARVQWDISF